jgi:photosystem II stability/assembly factor-like uncharacterized protein
MKKIIFAFWLWMLGSTVMGQQWSLLTQSPIATWRHDDLFFVHPDTGYVVNVDGKIYKTVNGGSQWTTLLNRPATSFRCVGFVNAQHGWAGNLGLGSWSPTTDTVPIYETTDGGNTWHPEALNGPVPAGICGIAIASDSVVYAVGRVGGPGHILKTTDAGQTWQSNVVPSPMFYLIDAHFFHPDTGVVSGTIGSLNQERFAIFSTVDGGLSWQTVYEDSSNHQGIAWKLSFPTRKIGYASIEGWPDMDTVPVMKTIDGGLSWQRMTFSTVHNWNQGIGFVDDSTGWCGATNGTVKKTTDGGQSWVNVPFVSNFNRMRRVNDTLAYASGNRIWKYGPALTTEISSSLPPSGLELLPSSPNPFASETQIRFRIPHNGEVVLSVYDWTGRPVKQLANRFLEAGLHAFNLEIKALQTAHFYVVLHFEGFVLTQKILLLAP